MEIILENQWAAVKINSHGAEMKSFYHKGNDREYIWQKGEHWWKQSAPVLFPNVGIAEDDYTIIEGNRYKASIHGFARDYEFSLEEQEPTRARFSLKWKPEMGERYPYPFELNIAYSLENTALAVTYTVKNQEQAPMDFAIGTHPTFRIPMVEGEDSTDYVLFFESEEDMDFVLGAYPELIKSDDGTGIQLPLRCFAMDSLIFEDAKSDYVLLQSKRSGRYVKVTTKEFPALIVWSGSEDVDFLCIEPWQGLPDKKEYDHDFHKKKHNVRLKAGEEYKATHTIEIG